LAREACLLAALAAGCGLRSLGGEPRLDSAEPVFVCLDALPATVTLGGDGFTPAVRDLVGDGGVVLPAVRLTRVKTLMGVPVLAEATVIENDPDSGVVRVRWTSEQRMEFDVVADLGLEAGIYDVAVENPGGESAAMPSALVLAPSPTITGRYPATVLGSPWGDVVIEVLGTPFIFHGSASPLFYFEHGTWSYWTRAAGGCHSTFVRGEVMSHCARIESLVWRGALRDEPAGSHAFYVSSLPGNTCFGRSSMIIEIVPCPNVTLVTPDVVCLAQGDRTISLSGSNLDFYEAGDPIVEVGETWADVVSLEDCTALPTPGLVRCGTIEFTLPARDPVEAADQTIAVWGLVSDPGCYFEPPILTVVPPPLIGSGRAAVEAWGATWVAELTGEFIVHAGSYPLVSFADAPAEAGVSAIGCDLISPTAYLCTTIHVPIPEDLALDGTYVEVAVSNPPPVGCTVESVVRLEVSP